MNRQDAAISVGLLCAAGALQPWVARDPLIHMLGQFPLLGAAGFIFGRRLQVKDKWAGAGAIVAIVTVLFWMLPRSLDGALSGWGLHLAKFLTLPLLAGLPLALAWPHLHRILRGLLKAEAVSMLGVLGFLYTHAPIRLCNSYLISEQIRLGYGFLWGAVALAILWALPVFFGPSFTWQPQKTRTILNDIR